MLIRLSYRNIETLTSWKHTRSLEPRDPSLVSPQGYVGDTNRVNDRRAVSNLFTRIRGSIVVSPYALNSYAADIDKLVIVSQCGLCLLPAVRCRSSYSSILVTYRIHYSLPDIQGSYFSHRRLLRSHSWSHSGATMRRCRCTSQTSD